MSGDEGAPLTAHQIFDGHNDLAWAMRQLRLRGVDPDISRSQRSMQTDLGRLAAGGVAAQFWSVYVPGTYSEDTSLRMVQEQIDLVRELCRRFPDELELAVSGDDIRRAMDAGRIASLLGAEGGRCIGSSLSALRTLRALGVRYMTLTHNETLPWADSATDVVLSNGLSAFGRDVVSEMNRVGMIVDLSHVAPATMHDALDHSTDPVIFSHSSARALTEHPRNVPDVVLERLKTNGGVCMVAFCPEFVSQTVADWHTELKQIVRSADDPTVEEAWRRDHPRPSASVVDVADHVDHVREVAGIEHVGVGGDFDGCDVMPAGLEDVSRYPALISELRARAWSEADLRRLAHANILRTVDDTHRPNLEYVSRIVR